MTAKATDITIQEYVKHFKNWKYSKIHHVNDDSFSYVALDGSTVKVYYPEFGQGGDKEGWKARKAESRAAIAKMRALLGGRGGDEEGGEKGDGSEGREGRTPVAEKKALLLDEIEELNDQIIELRNRREKLDIELDEIKAKNEALSGIDYEIIEISGVIRRIRQLISDEIVKMPRLVVSFKG